MTPTTAEWGLGGGRNHACLVHDSSAELMRVLEGEVVDAFDRGKRVIVLAESTTDQHLSDLFGRTGRGARDGQLDIRAAADVYLRDGPFDPAVMLTVLDDEKRSALADGFTGVHVMADMSWAAGDSRALDRLAAYEHAASAVFADGTATATCQYDRRRFGAEALTTCAAAHEAVVSAFEETESIGDDEVAIDIGRHGTLRVRGEIDLGNVGLLEHALAAAAERSDDVCVDASQLAFIDVRGLHALLQAARAHTLGLLAPSPPLRTMLQALDAPRQMPGLCVG